MNHKYSNLLFIFYYVCLLEENGVSTLMLPVQYATPKNNKLSSKYGYSDDPIEDEAMLIDDMDED